MVNRPPIEYDAPLSDYTSLGVGGPARRICKASDPASIARAIEAARTDPVAPFVLGGGTNLVVADAGFEGTILLPTATDFTIDVASGRCRAQAGVHWDTFARATVEADLGGIECLVGIPGSVGAAPVQNIGAYGQELADVLLGVECVELATGQVHRFDKGVCEFGYRSSRFKGPDRGRFLITEVELQLEPQAPPCLAYAQLRQQFDPHTTPTLLEVSESVRVLRRAKGMLLDATADDLRSVGSFFTNPVLDRAELATLRERLARRGADSEGLAHWKVDDDHTKVSAAWLIEASGLHRGHGDGRVGLSDRHVLALVNRGGATATEVVDFARTLRDRVVAEVGVRLYPEPVPLGLDDCVVEDLWGQRSSR